MKVTNRLLYSQLVKDLGNNYEKLFRLNSQISSGKRVNAPSDDPLGMSNILTYRSGLNAVGQYKQSADYANGWIAQTDSILQDMDNLMSRASELAVQGASATATADTREGAAEEIKQIRGMMLSHANARYGNKYLFGGTMTQTQPFLDVDVEKWEDDVSTMAATPPAAPADGDRYIDTDDNHIYTYDAATTTWIDQGAPDDGTSVVISDRDELYVYTGGEWKTLYQGNGSTFSMQIGKGDSITVNIPGDEIFTKETGNIFMTLMKLEKALRANDQTGIKDELTNIETSSTTISNNLARLGAVVNRIDHTKSVLETSKVNLEKQKSTVEDLDYAEGITSLQNQQVIYQAALKSASMITSLSLVDYIQ
jgi:flagellar hook-associated protein 3 FlgL